VINENLVGCERFASADVFFQLVSVAKSAVRSALPVARVPAQGAKSSGMSRCDPRPGCSIIRSRWISEGESFRLKKKLKLGLLQAWARSAGGLMMSVDFHAERRGALTRRAPPQHTGITGGWEFEW